MKTYQDLLAVGESEANRMDFVRQVINDHKGSQLYRTAKIAHEYLAHRNTTITQYQKLLYTVSGRAVPDNYSANYKIPSNFFNRFVTQQNQYLLGNGINWKDDNTRKKLGEDFDTRLQEAGKEALVSAVSFGFYNFDHTEVFSVLEFAPLYDEENGALMAGVRFWQIDTTKPLRATLYEPEGLTEYIWTDGIGKVLRERTKYITSEKYTDADGVTIYDGENYPTFPIVPLWGNPQHQSELVGIREQIDAYDLIKSGFANDLDDVSQIYWTISNAGGMDDIDLAQFVERMKTVKAVNVDDGEQVQAHTVSIPFDSREALLDRLRKDMYRDYMALDTDEIAGGAVTATQIKAGYAPMDMKANEYEYCVNQFVAGILRVAGIEDEPTFTRTRLINQGEEMQNLVTCAEFLPADYITEKLLTLIGDVDRIPDIIAQMTEQEQIRGELALSEE